MADVTILNLPMNYLKIQEVSEGHDVLVDTIAEGKYVQGVVTPKVKPLIEPLTLSLAAAGETWPEDSFVLSDIDMSVLEAVLVTVEIPMALSYGQPEGIGITVEFSGFLNDTLLLREVPGTYSPIPTDTFSPEPSSYTYAMSFPRYSDNILRRKVLNKGSLIFNIKNTITIPIEAIVNVVGVYVLDEPIGITGDYSAGGLSAIPG